MPGGDRTGPVGAGPMTGRGAGFCAGYDVPGYMNNTPGRGFGGGRGWGMGRGFRGGGRGWRHQYYATGLPGWAREASYPYPYSSVMPSDPGTSRDTKAAQAEELMSLKEQTRYFKGVLEELEERVNKLQEKAGSVNETQK